MSAATGQRVLHPSYARQIVRDLVDEHALKGISERLADLCHPALVDVDVDMLGPAAVAQALDEIREAIATMSLTCTWDDNAAVER